MNSLINLRGEVLIKIKDIQGTILKEYKGRNLIVNGGKTAVTNLLINSPSITDYMPQSISFGTSNTPPTVADTTITNAFNVLITSATSPVYNAAVFTATLGANDYNGETIEEIGLMRGDGTLFARFLTGSVEKSSSITMSVEWTIYS